MADEITIERKSSLRGDDEHKVISIRVKNELISRLDRIASEANRSRNEVINLLLEAAVSIVKVKGCEKNESEFGESSCGGR